MSERRIPFNITLPPDDATLLSIVRAEVGSLSEFVHENLVAFVAARLEKGTKLTGLEGEIASVKARIAGLDADIRARQEARRLDQARLAYLEEEHRKEQERLAGKRQARIATTPEELVDAHWHLLPPPGPARAAELRDLAQAYGLDVSLVNRAAAARHKLEAERQTNLRALPTTRKPTFGAATEAKPTPKKRAEPKPDCEQVADILAAVPEVKRS